MNLDLQNKINRGEIDCNNQTLFFGLLLKGFILSLNRKISIRGKGVPHYILNTGSDIMYLEKKGQDASIEPKEVSNENFIYTISPRAMVTPGGIDIQTDQLTSPYTRGDFDIEYEGAIYGFNAEFRRMPIKMSVDVKYTVDTFTDALDIAQQLIAHLAFVQTYNIDYMGQTIACTYKLPESFSTDFNMQFDGLTTESKSKTVPITMEIESNFPVYEPRTAIQSDLFVGKMQVGIKKENQDLGEATV